MRKKATSGWKINQTTSEVYIILSFEPKGLFQNAFSPRPAEATCVFPCVHANPRVQFYKAAEQEILLNNIFAK